jgi:hypothetical protein
MNAVKFINLDYTAKYPGGPFMSEEILGAPNAVLNAIRFLIVPKS